LAASVVGFLGGFELRFWQLFGLRLVRPGYLFEVLNPPFPEQLVDRLMGGQFVRFPLWLGQWLDLAP
jgi:hypothetical protein